MEANTAGMRQSKRRRVLICIVLVNLLLGLNYAWSVFLKALVDSGWSNADAALPSTIAGIAYSLAMLLFGLFQEKYGPKITISLGALLVGAGLVISGFFMHVAGLVLGFGLIYGLGIGACFSVTQATALKWSTPQNRGRISGVTSFAFGLSTVIMAWVSNHLLINGSISHAFYTFAISITPLLLLLGRFISLPGPQQVEAVDSQAALPTPRDKNCFSMIKDKNFYYVLGIYVFSTAAVMVPVTHISMIVSLQGNLSNAYIFVSIISICNCLGRLGCGYLGDRFSERGVLIISGVISAANMLLFGQYTSPFSLALGGSIAGLHFGSVMALIPVLLSNLFGSKYCAQNYGLISCFGLLSGLIGTQAAGHIVDVFHSYHYAYILCFIYLLISLILTLRLPKGKLL